MTPGRFSRPLTTTMIRNIGGRTRGDPIDLHDASAIGSMRRRDRYWSRRSAWKWASMLISSSAS
jgi:hypothetical protein